MVHLRDGHESLEVKRWAKKNMNMFTLVKGAMCPHRIVMPGHKMCSIILRVVLKGDK